MTANNNTSLDTSTSWPQVRLIVLVSVLITLFSAAQKLLNIWPPKSSLIALRGTIQGCETYVTTVESRRRFTVKSLKKAELIFYLNEFTNKFTIFENIGSDYRSDTYEVIKSKLIRADSVTVWIKKDELKYRKPKVFGIDTDGETVLDFQTVRLKNRPLTGFLLLTILGCVILSIYLLFPKLFKKHQDNTEKQPPTL